MSLFRKGRRALKAAQVLGAASSSSWAVNFILPTVICSLFNDRVSFLCLYPDLSGRPAWEYLLGIEQAIATLLTSSKQCNLQATLFTE
jgi:hypothetical protein